MRLHHVLCERLGKAVVLAEEAKALRARQVKRWTTENGFEYTV